VVYIREGFDDCDQPYCGASAVQWKSTGWRSARIKGSMKARQLGNLFPARLRRAGQNALCGDPTVSLAFIIPGLALLLAALAQTAPGERLNNDS
jgi:hypothetical protein